MNITKEQEFDTINDANTEVRKQITQGLDNFFAHATDRQLIVERLYEKPMLEIKESGDSATIKITLCVKG